ncbi:TIGR03885 family FMN-dependent LLM class oxidoreductase [Sphingobacterium suaedae]|uniref:TIGR03885 family FMN-dependent LLM class oxidoreductase n=2 Tax=Sphingobacterium suaedae TaxID=1686402 RepID=A0ABW5KCU8_9SPHI
MQIGYHASHEQFSPRDLLRLVQIAEQSGFQSILSSDHFHPWSQQDGQSGFAWSWLGAAMHATTMEFGIVNAPGQRYHPAIIAQAVATLDNMFPGRFWIALGSGQALNEQITGTGWPSKELRHKRLEACADVMRRLWKGENVTRHDDIRVQDAQLYTRPSCQPTVYGAALTVSTATWVGTWADGLITVNQDIPTLQAIIDGFRQHNPNGKLILKLQVSYNSSVETAVTSAWQAWRNNTLGHMLQADLPLPQQYDAAGIHITPRHVAQQVLAATDPSVYVDAIRRYKQMGFNKIILHNVNREQDSFLAFMGREVLPSI